ncbi:glycosyltransferase [Proteiniphilum saccharofermentans]|uniref:glycosyltransferase n=1 Tax=Proteiniphilum saccharofermentans TaxID=1642647 RepID=UPI001587E143|nr:galactosyltransferase-related protein [Proteiniphilum saccharofermentans]
MENKISFCITCMNRLHHIQQTLQRNIEDNNLDDSVEFVLLDYNSSDGLENWIKEYMTEYIDCGILSFYRTLIPELYHRSHSRNVAFRLARGNIVCNLDADNFLGNSFAAEMLNEFSINNNIFYTSDLSSTDIYGRIVLLKKDFIEIGGYNEDLEGYGHEDADLFNRLVKKGIVQKYFYNRDYYNAISHSKEERISNEVIYKKFHSLYLSYINPNRTEILILFKDGLFEKGIITDNIHGISQYESNPDHLENTSKIRLENYFEKGEWFEFGREVLLKFNSNQVQFTFNDHKVSINGQDYYKVLDPNFIHSIVLLLTMKQNEQKSIDTINQNLLVNPNGFGKCTVYKNFDYQEEIFLT